MVGRFNLQANDDSENVNENKDGTDVGTVNITIDGVDSDDLFNQQFSF